MFAVGKLYLIVRHQDMAEKVADVYALSMVPGNKKCVQKGSVPFLKGDATLFHLTLHQ